MQTINSIAEIIKTIDTAGSSPVVVMCEDHEYYVCKYGKPHDLLNELVASFFAQIWGLYVPSPALVRIKPEHIPPGLVVTKFRFTSYGCKYLEYAIDINQFFTTWAGNQYEIGKIINREDILKIGLFDLWLSNEDRNHNNSNLLINPVHDGNYIVAIDHVNIFNSSTLEHGLVQMSKDESLLSTEYLKVLYKKGEKLTEAIRNVEESFYVCVQECQNKLDAVLNCVPPDWQIDLANKKVLIEQIFQKDWLQETLNSFRLYLAQTFS